MDYRRYKNNQKNTEEKKIVLKRVRKPIKLDRGQKKKVIIRGKTRKIKILSIKKLQKEIGDFQEIGEYDWQAAEKNTKIWGGKKNNPTYPSRKE